MMRFIAALLVVPVIEPVTSYQDRAASQGGYGFECISKQ